MNSRFTKYTEGLEAKWQELKSMPSVIAGKVPRDTPEGGVYLFSGKLRN